MWLWEHVPDLRTDVLTLHLLKVVPAIRRFSSVFTIRKGLADPSENIARKLFDFWNHEDRLEKRAASRLKQTLTVLYTPEVEADWLKFSNHLLLALTFTLPEYKRVLFDPLEGATFVGKFSNTRDHDNVAVVSCVLCSRVTPSRRVQDRYVEQPARRSDDAAIRIAAVSGHGNR